MTQATQDIALFLMRRQLDSHFIFSLRDDIIVKEVLYYD